MPAELTSGKTKVALREAVSTILSRLPRRFSLGHVAPENLSRLTAFALALGPDGLELQHAVADRLFDLTIRTALESSSFYAQHLSGLRLEDDLVSVGRATEVPALTRDNVLAAGTGILRRDATYGFTTYTTGTTTGRPLLIDRSIEEQRYIHQFFTSLQKIAGHGENSGVAVVLDTNFHGRSVEVPTSYLRLPVSVTTLHGLRTAEELLEREFRVGGKEMQPSVVGGHATSLLRLTAFLARHYKPGTFTNVTAVQSSCEYLSPESRRQLEEFWGVGIADRFGITESLCGARNCLSCNGYHFEPYGYPEVLDVQTGHPLTKKRGLLHITSFFPFAQLTPIIRYATGDVAEVIPGVCPSGRDTYRFYGRALRSIPIISREGRSTILTETDIIDALEYEPAVLSLDRPNPFLPEYLSAVGTGPDFSIDTLAPNSPKITVRLRIDATNQPELEAALEQRLRDRLLSYLGLTALESPLPRFEFVSEVRR